ncbi:hypothetical protein DXT99_26820, partial [Pontibacter diazotrophicus]
GGRLSPYQGGTTPPANQPPTASAGADITITLPTSSVALSGSGTDTDGIISSYSWSQVSGPNTATLSGANSATLTAGSLMEGDYTFRLTVTDNGGAKATDEVNVLVSPAAPVNQVPVADAGPDMSVTLPVNSVALSGSGTDTDGTISSYSWSQVSGPNTATFSSRTVASPTVSALVEGAYAF